MMVTDQFVSESLVLNRERQTWGDGWMTSPHLPRWRWVSHIMNLWPSLYKPDSTETHETHTHLIRAVLPLTFMMTWCLMDKCMPADWIMSSNKNSRNIIIIKVSLKARVMISCNNILRTGSLSCLVGCCWMVCRCLSQRTSVTCLKNCLQVCKRLFEQKQ